MSINSLERIVNPTLLSKISKSLSSSSNSSKSALTASSNQELSPQELYDSLRRGAQNFGASMQLLNSSATFVNLSLDTTEKLLDMVTRLETIASKANKGNISSSAAKQMDGDFEKIADAFDKVIESATKGKTDIFDLQQFQSVLVNAGLDPTKISELSLALKRFTHPGEPTLNTDGAVVSDGNPVPLSEFQRALRVAIVDPDESGDDRSGYFGKVREKLKGVRIQLEGNIKALKDTTKLIGDNMTLVRAAGFAFLDVSNEMTGAESPEMISEQVRNKIRGSARSVLSQAHNLDPIIVAGLAALKASDSQK
jgi:hypothetical protein